MPLSEIPRDRVASDSDELGPPTQRSSWARHGVLALVVLMAAILYLDRMAINVMVPAIAEDLDIKISRVTESLAAFFWCYALMQIPAGWLGDRWGGRRALSLYVVAWSLAAGGLGLAVGPLSLLVMRGLLGIGQAGAYATAASLLRRWIPLARRGVANSAVSLGGRAGNVLAPFLTAKLMVLAAFFGWQADRWRPVYCIYAIVGIVWAIVFWFWFRDDPRKHSRANAAEVALIAGDAGDAAFDAPHQAGRLPLTALLKSRSLFALGAINFLINVGWIFVGTLLPTYLMRAHGNSEVEAGFAASLTAAAGMAGCLAGGWATDVLMHRVGLTWGRRLPCMVSYAAAALAYVAVASLDDVRAIVAVLVVASFMGDFGLGAMWSTFQDLGGAYAGTVLGAANMCGNIGAACALSVAGGYVESASWTFIFTVSAGAYLSAAVGWLLVQPRAALRFHALPVAAGD